MPSTFPGTLDNFTDPLSNSSLSSPSHAGQHQDLNDAVEKIETYMGLVKVIPTSATNGTVSATGTVTVGSAVSSVTVSGCFSSLYDNYKILYVGGTTSALTSLQMRLGASTTGYYSVVNYATFAATATPLSAGDNNAAQWTFVGYGTGSNTQITTDLIGPFLSQWTSYGPASWAAQTVAGTSAGTHQVATSYTAFTIIPNTGTMTGGTIRVYGYRN